MVRVFVAVGGKAIAHGDSAHAWQRLNSLEETRVKRIKLLRLFIARSAQGNLHGQNSLRADSGVDALQAPEALGEESRANQQHDCQREFCDHEQTVPAPLAGTFGRGTPAFFQRFLETQPRGLPFRRTVIRPESMPSAEITSYNTKTSGPGNFWLAGPGE